MGRLKCPALSTPEALRARGGHTCLKPGRYRYLYSFLVRFVRGLPGSRIFFRISKGSTWRRGEKCTVHFFAGNLRMATAIKGMCKAQKGMAWIRVTKKEEDGYQETEDEDEDEEEEEYGEWGDEYAQGGYTYLQDETYSYDDESEEFEEDEEEEEEEDYEDDLFGMEVFVGSQKPPYKRGFSTIALIKIKDMNLFES